jgi:hypothetical protein
MWVARLAGMEIGKLGGDRLTDDDRAGGAQPRDDDRIVARTAAG